MLRKRYRWMILALAVALGCDALPASQNAPAVSAEHGGIEGVVKGPDGKIVDGALVAANIGDESQSAVTTRTSNGGLFRFANLLPGSYGITATAPRMEGAFIGDISVAPGGVVRAIELKLGQDGIAVSGVVQDANAHPLKGARIAAGRLSSFSGDTFYSESDDAGKYTISLPKAIYFLTVKLEGYPAVPEAMLGDRDRTADFTLTMAAKAVPAPQAVTDWLNAQAIPLRTAEAEHGFADMEPLRKVIGESEIVSLGEATHGTREFFQVKHRMLEFLATNMGFTVFGIEANWPESLAVNDYVLNGKGDPAKALSGMYFWTWDTEEVLDMIHWMRRYNEDPAHLRKLKFYGFDMQVPCVAARAVFAYLRKVDPEYVGEAQKVFAPLANEFLWENRAKPSKEAQRLTADGIASVLKRFEQERQRYVMRSTERDWVVAQHEAQIVSQVYELATSEASLAVRDRAMADNIKWILDTEGPGTKVVVWAHNGHVQAGGDNLGVDSMGTHLREMFGDRMVIFGFAFNEGSFQSQPVPVLENQIPKAFTVGPAPETSLDAAFAKAKWPIYAIDLRRAPTTGPVADWLQAPLATRSIGSVFNQKVEAQYLNPIVAPKVFDAILFVEKTSAARPNPTVRLLRAPFERASAPTNLNLEEGALGAAPTGWWSNARYGYDARLTDDNRTTGKRCVVINRSEDTGVAGYGNMAQKFDATPYRGKTVRLRAAVRTDVGAAGNQAYLWLKVDAPDGILRSSGRAFEGPIVGKEWREFEIVKDVGQSADSVSFGLSLIGGGRAWFRDVSFEVVKETGETGMASDHPR